MYRKLMRKSKRQEITLIARLAAGLMAAVLIILSEFIYILAVKPGTKAYAEENSSEDVIVIPAEDTEGTDEKEEEKESPKPIVKITIKEPEDWHRKTARVKFKAEDIGDSGDFVIAEARAKIGNSGSWTDVTDSMEMELSEDSVVYVEITDTKGRTYSKNKKIICFDSTKPTLNAAVNNGNLTIETNDNDSGVKAVYVNGFEFTDLNEGTLNIRMQQFDTGYENFSIQAMDYAGNMSDTYRVNNPYYRRKDAENKDKKILPESAEPTKATEAKAEVIDHIKTDSDGNTLKMVSENSMAEEKKKALAEGDREEEKEEKDIVPGKGREFYTIEAKSGKVFYLIIDRDGEDEEVHFVTDITENDLLNVTEDNSSTIPQNSAYQDTDACITESALPNNILPEEISGVADIGPETKEEEGTEEISSTEEVSDDGIPWEEKKENPIGQAVFIVIIAVLTGGIIYAVKKIRNNPESQYSEEEDEPDDGKYPDEDRKSNVEADFFDDHWEGKETVDNKDKNAEESICS